MIRYLFICSICLLILIFASCEKEESVNNDTDNNNTQTPAALELSSSIYPQPNDSIEICIDSTITNTNFEMGEDGENKQWDFSMAIADRYSYVKYTMPQEQPNSSNFTDADIAFADESGVVSFITKSNTLMQTIGMSMTFSYIGRQAVRLNDPMKIHKFPVEYEDEFGDLANAVVAIPLDTTIDYNGTSLSIDSVGIDISFTVSSEIDGWGTVKTPTGSYQCLREFYKQIRTTALSAYSMGFPVPFQQRTDTMRYYRFYSDSIMYPVIEIKVDAYNNIERIEYMN